MCLIMLTHQRNSLGETKNCKSTIQVSKKRGVLNKSQIGYSIQVIHYKTTLQLICGQDLKRESIDKTTCFIITPTENAEKQAFLLYPCASTGDSLPLLFIILVGL